MKSHANGAPIMTLVGGTLAGLSLLAAIVASCASTPKAPTPLAPSEASGAHAWTFETSPRDLPGLHNVFVFSERLVSGSEPEGEAALAELARMGIKTIVSVDGAKPDLDAIKRHGMRSIHLPIGYDGISQDAQKALWRVAQDIEGPVYVHCHHGKHRGPASAAMLARAMGADEDTARRIMTCAGTGTEYTGLWHDGRKAIPAADWPDAPLPEVVEIPPLASAMVDINKSWERIGTCRKHGWKAPPDHPELDPAQEAVLLWEHMRETQRLTASNPPDFVEMMVASERHAATIKDALLRGESPDTAYQDMAATCRQCHESYRNNMANKMTDIGEHWSRLKASRKHGWKAPPDAPDLDPAHEAEALWGYLRQAHALSAAKPKDFIEMMAEAERHAALLKDALTRGEDPDPAYRELGSTCGDCHSVYKDD